MLVVDDLVYKIRKCGDGYFKAYLRINDRKYLYVTSAKTRPDLETKLKDKPMPKQKIELSDKISRLTPHQISTFRSVNEGRKLNGLPLLKIQIRKCLKCGDPFESTIQRICESCHSSSTFHHRSLQGREIL